jgi:hypothetical protein
MSASEIYHSSRVSIGKVKRVFCFSIVRDNQAKGMSTLARYTAKCGGIRPEKGPSWNSL